MQKALITVLALPFLSLAETQKFDVVVYGGTAGGVIAAVAVAREGLTTALLEPGKHLGGMVSGGLSWTDYGKKEVIGGYALEFYLRVGNHYNLRQYGQEIGWLPEPHVAEEIFAEMLQEAGVKVFKQTRLRENSGVHKTGTEVKEVVAENGDSFAARVFIDSSYEGDLMAQAGVAYTYGREGSATYGETLAGVRDRTPLHQFLVDVSPKRRLETCCLRFQSARYPRRAQRTKLCRRTTIGRAFRMSRRIRWHSQDRLATMPSAMHCSRV